jgi:outer membrane protein assembly factor BamD (BamD/ComL family)
LNAQLLATQPSAASATAGAAWYFYNPSSMSFGYTDFIKRWGNRPLEDNWRRSNKESVTQAEAEEQAKDSTKAATTVIDSTEDALISDIKDRKQYTRNIPLTAKQLERSNKKIIEALYSLTIIYKEQLQDNAESVRIGEDLLKRYPENKYKLPLYYHLYRTFLAMGKQERSDYYKNLLLNNYPDSEYAQIIKDPDYAVHAKERASKAQSFYKDTYQAYINGAYPDVINREEQARQLFPKNKILPKFDYLKALAIAKTQGLAAFELALGDIVKKYPNTEVKTQAEETLFYINEMKNRKPDFSIPAAEKEIYTFKADTIHYYVVESTESANDMAKLRTQLIEYNNKFYPGLKLNLTIVDLSDSKSQLLVIKQFKDKDDSEDYMYRAKEDPDAFSDFEDVQFSHFVISPRNYAALTKDKDLTKYLKFFKINYPAIAHF